GHRIRSHEAAVAASRHADALPIDVRVLGEPGDDRLDVLELPDAELSVSGPGRAGAFARGAAWVGAEDDEAHLGSHFVVQAASFPTVVDGRGMRARVGPEPYRIALGRVEIRRLQNAGLQDEAVRGWNLHHFVLAAPIF